MIISQLLLFLLLLTWAGTYSQIISDEPCRNLPILKHFDVERYLGTWYELNRYPRYDIPIASQDCSTSEFGSSDLPNRLTVINSGTNLDTMYHVRMEGYALISFPDEVPLRAILNVTFADDPSRMNYRILSTDYDHYSVVWYCVDTDTGDSLEYAWILSRSYFITGDEREEVDAIINKYFHRNKFIDVVQEQQKCLGEDITPALI